MKNLLIRIAQELVDDPEQVQVTEIVTAQTTVLELKVAKSDVGKIIGKQGKTANAIRVVLNAASGKARKRYMLEIVD
ncbi:MAG TPA: KH domain-containing protein [Desulfobacterales bacterium]|nr:KH domain-containing protein [Desulfobacterales bacterium]